MSPVYPLFIQPHYRFPRVSGDEPGVGAFVYPEWEFSPRERG